MNEHNQFIFGNLLKQLIPLNNLEVLRQNMFLSQIVGDILTQVKQSNKRADNFHNAFTNYTKFNGNQHAKFMFCEP